MPIAMLPAFLLACRDAFAAEQRRALALSAALALAAFAALWLGATWLLHETRFFGTSWLDTPIEILGSFAVLALSWLLFPALVSLMLGFFLDGVVRAVERQHYPGLPPARRLSFTETMGSALRLAGLALLVNLIILPFYLWPGINLLTYYGLNGYLLGREYFELVALRRLDRAAMQRLWRGYRGRLILAGAVIALLLTLPLVNLVAPLIAAAFMTHLVNGPPSDMTVKYLRAKTTRD